MVDNEVEVSAEVGLPFWSPIRAKVGARFKRTWETRRDEYVSTVADHAGLSPEELAEQCLEDSPVADLLMAGADRVTKVGDAFYRSAVAQLVGRAFDDDTKVDEVEYVTNLVLNLEPLDLRVLRAAYGDHEDLYGGAPVYPSSIVGTLRVDPAVVDGSLTRLGAVGFVKWDTKVEPDKLRAIGGSGPRYQAVSSWTTTGLGVRAIALCKPQIVNVTDDARRDPPPPGEG